jgi:hypothetical protein
LGNSVILGVAALFSSSSRGEILTELEETTVFKPRHFVRQISNCKSAQFPSISTVNSSLHTPGNFIDGQQVKHAETIISIDGLLVAPGVLQHSETLAAA